MAAVGFVLGWTLSGGVPSHPVLPRTTTAAVDVRDAVVDRASG
jgi:hypothetical protein